VGGLAEIIYATAAFIVAVGFLIGVIRGYRRLEAKVGKVHLVAEAVNAAVNNVQPGEPSLRNVVVGIGERLDLHVLDTNQRLEKIEDHLTNPSSKVNKAVDLIAKHVKESPIEKEST